MTDSDVEVMSNGKIEEEDEEEFVVEKILERRKKGDFIEYFLKWKNYPNSENTWEPSYNLDCQDMIDTFEAEYAKKGPSKQRGRPKAGGPASRAVSSRQPKSAAKKGKDAMGEDEDETEKAEEEDKKPSGVELNLAVDSITDVKLKGNELMFEFKFKGRTMTETVPSRTANIKYTRELIKFYQKKLSYYEKLDTEVEKTA